VHPAAAAPTALLLLLLLLLCTRAAGTSLNLKDKSTALSSLFMSKIAIVLCRSSRPESGLYQAVQAGHWHVTPAFQSHACSVTLSDDSAKREPLWPA
jgi:hypothetical protein